MSQQTPSMFDQWGDAKPGYRAADATSPPRHRASDPEPSKIAAENHEASGKLTRNCGIVLAILRRSPQSTYPEIFEAGTFDEKAALGDDKEVARRLPDLQKLGLADTVRGGLMNQELKRRCRINATVMRYWVATENKGERDAST